ncbi:MAG: prepilin peptidase [Lachnospiraceae bacterium]|nr:prepilin peptidase [Lachnospiraceae bacterium]
MLGYIAVFLFLIAASVWDLRIKKVPVYLFILWIAAGIGIYIGIHPVNIMDEVMGVVIGIVFLALSVVSEGKLGLGDGMAILVLGIYLGGRGAGFTCMYALILSAGFSIVAMILGRCSKNYEFPFMPFLLAGLLLHGAVNYI